MLANISESSATNHPPSVIGKTVEIERLLDSGGASLVYAGYPYDPYS
jgi:hypothetical protein